MTNVSPDDLVRRAKFAEHAGQFDEARAAWDALVSSSPEHPLALLARARAHIDRGDPAGSLPLFASAEARDPANAEIPFFHALAHRMLGDVTAAIAALDRALAIDPYFFMALLSKAALYEKRGDIRNAARIYAPALKIAPALERLSPSQRQMVAHAKEVIAANAQELAQHLRARTDALRADASQDDLGRFDECLDILAGVKSRPVQDPLGLFFPELPAISFYKRDYFPWLSQLEAATDMIRGELEVVLREDTQEFSPYIQLRDGAPINQWTELNHSRLWSTFYLWRDGVRYDRNCERCPKTAALLATLPMAHQAGFGPTAMFSVLQPRTRIPPHTGSTNVRLLTHLPLILPPQCRFRVGNHTRDWRMGEAWVFDDTIDHEAHNDSDEVRVILIFDVWNPLLSLAERALISQLMTALTEYNPQD